MATNKSKDFFSKSKEYQTQIETGIKCPVKYYSRKINPYRYTNRQVLNGLNSINNKKKELNEQLENIKYNETLLNYRKWDIVHDVKRYQPTIGVLPQIENPNA